MVGPSVPGMTTDTSSTSERDDIIELLQAHRGFLLHTVDGLTDDQARERSTTSELTLGGLIKHVTAVEKNWAAFIVRGPSASPDFTKLTEEDYKTWADGFRLLPGETFADALAMYEEVAKHTDELAATLPDLGADHPLPPSPWNPPGECWSARRTLMHIAGETFQHAGHADIIRESLDGAKSMG